MADLILCSIWQSVTAAVPPLSTTVLQPLGMTFSTASMREWFPWKKASYLNSHIDPFQTICSAGASLRLLSVPESKPIQVHSYARGHSSLVRLGIFIQLVSSEETNRQGNLQAIFFSILDRSSLIISSSYREVRHSMVFT